MITIHIANRLSEVRWWALNKNHLLEVWNAGKLSDDGCRGKIRENLKCRYYVSKKIWNICTAENYAQVSKVAIPLKLIRSKKQKAEKTKIKYEFIEKNYSRISEILFNHTVSWFRLDWHRSTYYLSSNLPERNRLRILFLFRNFVT